MLRQRPQWNLVGGGPVYLYLGCVCFGLVLLNYMSSHAHKKSSSMRSQDYNQLRYSRSHFSSSPGKLKNDSSNMLYRMSHKSTKSSSDKTDDLILNFIPEVKVTNINCQALIQGDKDEIKQALVHQRKFHKNFYQNADYIHLTKNCSRFIDTRKYTIHPLSQEEADFPLAFSILIFKDLEQFERLLRAIYRPQNYYCVHVDAKVSEVMWEAATALMRCFDNVFMASKSIRVKWGTYSVLEPEFICMHDLWKFKDWRYFINLTGQEFPLQTMGELVKILKILKGANNAEGTVKRRNKMRTKYVANKKLRGLQIEKFPRPVPVTLTKGSVHIVAQRGFIDYVLHKEEALKFREWVKDTGVPDETFFSSLIHSPQLGVPGSYLGKPETDKIDSPQPRHPFIARFKNWGNSIFNWTCHGRKIRGICVFGVGDLKLLSQRHELFANKFLLDVQPLAYECMEELHYNRTKDGLRGIHRVNLTFYSNLDIVENHL